MTEKNVTRNFWQYVANRAANEYSSTGLFSRIYKWLDRDIINGIIVNGNSFWIEPIDYPWTMPKYVHAAIVEWGKRQGWTYLYDII